MLKSKIISKAKTLGFDLIGFTPFQILEIETNNLHKWLSNDYHAGMTYMERNTEKRKNVTDILPNCKSIISLGMNYFIDEDFNDDKEYGKVSRYAWGKDYHFIMWEKLDLLVEYIKSIEPSLEAKSYVDTGPVMDKAWAVKAGLGWQGKHSNIISRNKGSWFFIATILTTYEFENFNVPVNDFCGSCTACIDACPTNAIVEDYVVDSNKCISYLTIENKEDISDEFIGRFENWIFGCDICQDVCPWNKKFAEDTGEMEFHKIDHKTISHNKIENMESQEFKNLFSSSPILRTKVKGLKRNSDFLKKLS